jgi:hypothetical protein
MSKRTPTTARSAIPWITLAAALFAGVGFAAADEVKGKLLFPWEAQGKVYETGRNTLMFVGEIVGTLYADSGKGALDGASMVCPMLYEIDAESNNTRSEGRCAIYPKGSGEAVYAAYSCHGQVGSCAGRLDLTGGTGKFSGISGSGDMVSRTGTSELAIRLGPGGGISNGEGLMTLRGFSYKTP